MSDRAGAHVTLLRIVDYSPTVHAVTEANQRQHRAGYGEHVTFCGKDAEESVLVEGHAKDVTCLVCKRSMARGGFDV